jgi:hypothetical protein
VFLTCSYHSSNAFVLLALSSPLVAPPPPFARMRAMVVAVVAAVAVLMLVCGICACVLWMCIVDVVVVVCGGIY